MNKFVTDPARTSYRKPKPPKGKEKKPNSKQNNPLSKVRKHRRIQSTTLLPTEISTSTLLSLFSSLLFSLSLSLSCTRPPFSKVIQLSQYFRIEAALLLRA